MNINRSLVKSIAIYALILAVILLAYYYVLHRPQRNERHELQEELSNLERNIEELEELLVDAGELEEELLEKEAEVSFFEERERLEKEDVISVLKGFAEASALEVEQDAISEKERGYLITINFKGDFMDVISYFARLEEWDKRLTGREYLLTPADGKIEVTAEFKFHQP